MVYLFNSCIMLKLEEIIQIIMHEMIYEFKCHIILLCEGGMPWVCMYT